MNFRLGNYLVTLVKQVAGVSPLQGREKPGHKYIRRIPLGAGGYKYIYKEPDGKEREEVLTHKEARIKYKEDFDPNVAKFTVQSENAKEILGFSDAIDNKYFEVIKERFTNPRQYSAAAGEFKETVFPIAIAIGEGFLHNLDDAIVYANQLWESYKGSDNRYDVETSEKLSQFLTTVKFLKDAKTPQFDGRKLIEISWYHGGLTWTSWKSTVENKTGKKIDHTKFRLIPVGRETGQHIIADALLEKTDDQGNREFVDGFSAKVNAKSGKPVSLKDGSWLSNVAEWSKNFGDEDLREFGDNIEKIYKEVKELSIKNKWDIDQRVGVLSGRMNKLMADSFGVNLPETDRTDKQKNTAASYAQMMIDRFHRFHDDPRAKDVFMTVTSINKDDTVSFYQTKGSDMKKIVDDWLSKGPISIKMTKTNEYKAADGNVYSRYNPVELVGGSEKNRKTFLIQENRWSGRDNVQIRSPFEFMRSIFSLADKKDQKTGATTKLIDEMEGFKAPEGLTIKSIGADRPNHKYIRKIVTPGGKVRYIYKETDSRQKKANNDQMMTFMSKVDSVSPEFTAIFENALGEIDNDSFQNINAGTSAVRFTADSDTFIDFLGVSEEQKQNAEFDVATGTFGAISGKMAFNVANFPAKISEAVKKRVMLHEIGHAWFFGTLRMKSHKSLVPGSFENIDKDHIKKSSKFVDDFGRLDKEMRAGIDEQLVGVKGKDKEEITIEKMKETFVDLYSAKDDFENFAQSFAYYFTIPEVLKKKVPKMYELFNDYFQKYEG